MSGSFRSQTLGAIVGANYQAAAVLERYGLDFCCGGKRTLEEACAQRRVDPASVEGELGGLAGHPLSAGEPDSSWDPAELTVHIVRRHHAYVRDQIPVIGRHLAKLARVHGDRHPELHSVAVHFGQIAADLQMHMVKEEEILFPYIRALSTALTQGTPAPPDMFGTVRNPIRMMEAEHQSAGNELEAVRRLTGNFTLPEDACATYRVCFAELEAFDRDLRLHIHLENNILFPKALSLEAALAGREIFKPDTRNCSSGHLAI
jgi:regulator of cell morphogenesis and NO signaling